MSLISYDCAQLNHLIVVCKIGIDHDRVSITINDIDFFLQIF